MKRYPFLVVLALFLLRPPDITSILAQTNRVVDLYIQFEMKKRRIPGLALVVIKNGEIIKMQGYGVANLEHDTPVTPDTVFDLASVTKQFTATAIMSLVEEGKIKLDDPIIKYLPRSPRKWNGITVRHLLTHTAGLASLDDGFASLPGKTDYSTAELFKSATEDPMSFAPGAKYQYSDVNYFLLGMIIEKAGGQRYGDFLAMRFFKPLGMTSTSIDDQWAVVKNRAAGYTIRNGQLANIRRVQQLELLSHAGVFSTVRDLAKWDNALSSGKVVKESSLAAMWTPVKLNSGRDYPYGFGWEFEEIAAHRVITHSGITGTEYTRLPDDKLTVIVLTNLGSNDGSDEVNSWGLTQGVARRYLPEGLRLPRVVSEKEALEAIEKAVEEKRRKLNVPGAALVIVRNDRVILLKGFGLRDVAAGLPVTPETLFPIGSSTKTFTAMAAVISADEGKLSLDDSPQKYLPYFKLRDPEADAHVTLRDLLCHRSGLEAYGGDASWQGGKRSREAVIRIGMQAKQTAKFREKWQYSNIMYLAVGEATAKAQNSTWEGVVSDRIFKPLGMSASNFSVRAMGRTADFSLGYHNRDGKLEKFPALDNMDSVAPAGAINSNAKDMGQWLRLLLGGGAIDGKRLVSEKGFQEMLVKHTKVGEAQFGDEHYGLGLFVDELDKASGRRLYFHPGTTDGFYAMVMFAPALRLGFAILTNGNDSALPDETAQIVFNNLLLARQP
ncbi:MAG TPA: serine hydrolase domain-containing protein [Blastocatellia bacterium]|nr:serine hydrolase domain-containing protein [Blastocatellia bacterium]